MLSKLLIDHDHIQKTLNLLEIQFLDLCRDRAVDYSVMQSIVVYIQEYPEQTHHPLEDAMLAILIRQGGKDVALARELLSDHTELEGITRTLRKSLESQNEGGVSRDELMRQLSEFLLRQRRHLYVEEMKVYPLVKRILTRQDWDDIQKIVPPIDDPVFGKRTRNDYDRLYRMIEGGRD
jgi:hemerythrin-like domain-containing protein